VQKQYLIKKVFLATGISSICWRTC